MRHFNRGLGLVMLAAILWGTVGVSTKTLYGLGETNALSIGFFRLALAAPVLGLTGWVALRQRLFQIPLRDLALMALIGVMLALYQVCYFGAIAYVGVAVATLVTLCTAPVLVALLSVVFLRERLSLAVIGALGLAVFGTVLLVGSGDGGSLSKTVLPGVFLAVGSALGYAVVTLAGRNVAPRYPSVQTNAVAFATGALLLLILASRTGLIMDYTLKGWAILAYLGLVPTALAYGLFLWGMRSTRPTVASIVTLLEPLTATVLAYLLFAEHLGPSGLLGGVLLIGAILILTRQR